MENLALRKIMTAFCAFALLVLNTKPVLADLAPPVEKSSPSILPFVLIAAVVVAAFVLYKVYKKK